jgi:poly(hydroxyalkanoate) granule-associated protein
MARNDPSQDEAARRAAETLGESLVDSAQKIWLAGLGAFSRARDEGDNMFNALVEQGKGVRTRTRGAADEALKTIRSQADATVGEAQVQFGKLEQAFEQRLARSLNRLGMLTREEADELGKQVQELNQSVQQLLRTQASAARKTTARAKAAPARKRTARKKKR